MNTITTLCVPIISFTKYAMRTLTHYKYKKMVERDYSRDYPTRYQKNWEASLSVKLIYITII